MKFRKLQKKTLLFFGGLFNKKAPAPSESTQSDCAPSSTLSHDPGTKSKSATFGHKPRAGGKSLFSKITLLKNIKFTPKTLSIAGGAIAAVVLAIVLLGGSKDRHAGAVTMVVTPNPSMLALMYSPEPTPDPMSLQAPEPSLDLYKPLTPGESAPEVEALQQRLMDLDYMDPDEPTELYGKITQYALQLFQREHKLQVDGVAGEETLQLLYSDDAKPYVTQLGDRGVDVEEYQKQLIELGYLKDTASGKYGDNTVKAVTAFQTRNGLKADGKIGMITREMLYSDDAKLAPTPKPKATKKPTTSQTATAAKKSTAPKKTPGKAVAAPDEKGVNAMIAFAKQHMGYPYVRGGKGPGTFDCSGFVYWCLKNSGVKISYMTSAGWAKSSYPEIKNQKDLKAGDILCFKGHVGIYLGNGQMIDASSGQGKVRICTISSNYWQKSWICGRRVF